MDNLKEELRLYPSLRLQLFHLNEYAAWLTLFLFILLAGCVPVTAQLYACGSLTHACDMMGRAVTWSSVQCWC